MDWCVLSLPLLMLCKHGLQEEVCSKSVISCNKCIESGPFYSWCQQLNFTKAGELEAVRCDTQEELMARGCNREEIISPQNNQEIKQQDPLSESLYSKEPVQMTPQKINLKLRPGLPHKFNVSFKRAERYPVDLYYLMDLSYSMKDDLDNVKNLGGKLFDALNNITDHANIGFGAFVDKPVLPFTNTNKEKLEKPCDDNMEECQAAFGYRHVLSLTPSREAFTQKVKDQLISGNLDSPEGSLDAMMQAAVCGDKIGWRNNSTRLIVLATDAGFHMAGDGKLAGILEPNDELCHMKDNLYEKSNEMDYPSVGQLAMQLEKNNIQSIFAVTEDVKKVYMGLTKLIPKSVVGVLSSDSSNVVQLIESAYNNLTSKITVTHDILPNNVRVEYSARCQHKINDSSNKGVCDQVTADQEISFEVTVTVDKCMEEKSFTISPLGIKDKLTVTVSTNCECQCNDPIGSNQPHCNNSGSITCGICSCNQDFVGQFCNCSVGSKEEDSLRASCQRQNGMECEGRGDCVCGRCQCHTTEQGSSYHGKYCEFDSEQCEKYENKLCGGHGTCKCGECDCEEGYKGSACQCKTSKDGCQTPDNSVCYGRGECECNKCKCIEGYYGTHCKECTGCTSVCLTKLSCVSCLGLSHSKENCNNVCNNSISKYEKVEKFNLQSKECHQKDSEGCWIKFKLDQLTGEDNYNAEILKMRECPEPPNITAIIAGSLAAVAVIGILLLILIKLLIHMKDLKEFKKFENEKKKSKWANADNPLFKNATTTVANPLFTGE